MALLVSGGHSSLLLVPDVTCDVQPLGSTIDDAAGEAFDKVARVLGLPFPGGPHIDRVATGGDRAFVTFPRGLTAGKDMARHRFDFSFSGLKTAVARWVEAREAEGEPVPVADVAAAFQEAVVDVLTRKAIDACREHGVTDLQIGGGVAANSRLRALAAARCDSAGIRLRIPQPGAVHRQRGHGGRPGRPGGRPWAARPRGWTCPRTPPYLWTWCGYDRDPGAARRARPGAARGDDVVGRLRRRGLPGALAGHPAPAGLRPSPPSSARPRMSLRRGRDRADLPALGDLLPGHGDPAGDPTGRLRPVPRPAGWA